MGGPEDDEFRALARSSPPHGEPGQEYAVRPDLVYPDGWLVGLDFETGVVVSIEPVGGSRRDLGFTVEIHSVDS